MNKLTAVCLVALGGAIVGGVAGRAYSNSDHRFRQLAMEEIRGQMRDPESARFKDIYIVRSPKSQLAACGVVNAKNAFGGYVGERRFVVNGIQFEQMQEVVSSSVEDADAAFFERVYWEEYCAP